MSVLGSILFGLGCFWLGNTVALARNYQPNRVWICRSIRPFLGRIACALFAVLFGIALMFA